MERDFMGLSVKLEAPDEIIDAAPVRSLPMQWSFSSKSSAHPQLFSFQNAQDAYDKPKYGFDSLASSGIATLTTDVFDSNHRQIPASQKSIAPERQGAVRYTVTNYASQHVDTHTIRRPITTPPAVTHQPYVAPMAGVPNAVHPKASTSSIVGDFRKTSKISNAPAQLTIFYNGSVCVYDNISPEKAQAIMLLAGNGPPLMTPKATSSPAAAPVQAVMPRSSVLDRLTINQPYATTPRHSSPVPTPRRSSPVPMTPISVSQSAGRAGIMAETSTARPSGVHLSPPIVAEPLRTISPQPLRTISPLGSASFLTPDTVPQFRRKSLARFLEKRKERMISASPYGDCQSADCSADGAGATSLSMNSSGSCPVPAAT